MRIFWMFALGLSLALCAAAQQDATNSASPASTDKPAPTENFTTANRPSGITKAPISQAAEIQPGPSGRVLGLMPNFRVVRPGDIAPPPTAKRNFMLATRSSFDYSSFVFTGFTSALAQWTDSDPQFGQGMRGYEKYYRYGFLDKTDGNYLVMFALPAVFRQDERYYALGKGGWRRIFYAASRVLITPNYRGYDSFNVSELLGRGIAQGISVAYYPVQDRTIDHNVSRYGFTLARDALTNIFVEFWPDIQARFLHHHHRGADEVGAD